MTRPAHLRVRDDLFRTLSPLVPGDAGLASEVHAGVGQGGAERWHLLIESDLTRLAEARGLVDEVADVIGMGARARYQLKLAVHEAVINAMQHGAAFRAPVRLSVRLDVDHVTFVVADPGPVFTVACPSEPDLRDHGRGLMLMSRCVDDVAVHALPVGKELHLTKRLVDAGQVNA